MKNNYTDITMILDESGSMGHLREDVLGSFKTFIEEQSKVEGECMFTMVKFSNDLRIETVKDIKEVGDLSYFPSGGTALLDAIGESIQLAGKRFKEMKEEDRPEKVIFVILTDGEENSSKEFTREKIFEMISEQESKYNWKFIYLGANQDAIAVGAQYNINQASSMTFNANSRSYGKAFSVVTSHVSAYRNSGDDMDLMFSLNDREDVIK